MITFNPTARARPSTDTRSLFIETFKRQIAWVEKGRVRLRVPHTPRLFERHAGMQYHFKPELFIQLGGVTDFIFPDRRFTLEPGEICLMPKGVPHGETARAADRPFENVVVCYYNETVAIHVAHALPSGKPIVDDIFFYTTGLYGDLVEYLNRIAELTAQPGPASAAAAKGLLLAELALLLATVEQSEAGPYSETERVARCQWLIRSNSGDPELGVEALAAELRCSPSHLSRIFHDTVGERIVEYITRIRLNDAMDAIRHSTLSVKEIAACCGFSDPNYFARVFRRSTGRSPMEFRQDLQHVACTVEKEPKVVYHDREEKGFGLRPEVMAKAKVKMAR